jgi:hypothetical protein
MMAFDRPSVVDRRIGVSCADAVAVAATRRYIVVAPRAAAPVACWHRYNRLLLLVPLFSRPYASDESAYWHAFSRLTATSVIACQLPTCVTSRVLLATD